MSVLNRLVEKGNTVLVIEHNLDVVKWTAAGRVYPNPLPQGTPLTIEFDNEVEAARC